MKTYVLDTNVLLHDPHALFVFQDNAVVIPLAVVEELDQQKKRQDEVGRNARTVSRQLDALREYGGLAQGVATPQGGSLRVELNHSQVAKGFPEVLDLEKMDNRILSVAWNLKQLAIGPVILVTKDLNIRVKADVMGITVEDFRNDKVDYDSLYTGTRNIFLEPREVERFYAQGRLKIGGRRRMLPHQFAVIRCREQPSLSALARHENGDLLPLAMADAECMGLKPRNKEQRFALELLLRDEIRIVTLAGPAGTGKTLLALAAGLEKVMEQRAYRKLLVTRPLVPMGQDLGYLPGEKEEKLRPWMQPLNDNLEFLFREYPAGNGKGGGKPFGTHEYLMAQGMLELEALTYIRGRSIPQQFIICDEAQNLTPHMVKTLITRVGQGSKIVFTGDPEQIDHPYLDASSNGLTHLVEKMKQESLSGHVSLVKGERSRVAELGASLL
ncbi:MAG: PhoH family protein [Desulfarculus sp.]|nr:PhoH family protein [Desulfarculus sp.]